MSERNLYFAIAFGLFFIALTAVSAFYYRRIRRSTGQTWEDLIARLTWVDRDKLALVALDAIAESGEPRNDQDSYLLEPSVIWDLTGGLKGLEILERNCQVLVDLAFYLQKWHPEALVVAEQLRLSSREIEWHVKRLRGAAQTGNLQSTFSDYGQRAVVVYYLMTKHLLSLYEQTSAPAFIELQREL